jgi:EAL domain-containing protein (putative c-di-GMP-specific phosphodiesterase class I)
VEPAPTVVEAVVSLAHALGNDGVTAEGVEELAQQAALRALRRDHLQGFPLRRRHERRGPARIRPPPAGYARCLTIA